MEGEGERYSEEYTNTQRVSLICAEWLNRGFAFVVIDEFRFDDGLSAWKKIVCESVE